eukprot:1137448-Pelagomonas_calceolata.AAC.1
MLPLFRLQLLSRPRVFTVLDFNQVHVPLIYNQLVGLPHTIGCCGPQCGEVEGEEVGLALSEVISIASGRLEIVPAAQMMCKVTLFLFGLLELQVLSLVTVLTCWTVVASTVGKGLPTPTSGIRANLKFNKGNVPLLRRDLCWVGQVGRSALGLLTDLLLA